MLRLVGNGRGRGGWNDHPGVLIRLSRLPEEYTGWDPMRKNQCLGWVPV